MYDIKKLSKKELKILLKDLKTYKDLVKKVWNRWREIFDHIYHGHDKYFVEYYGDADTEYIAKKAKSIYEKVFKKEVKKKNIEIKRNDTIGWWMKVYCNDSLIDLSFLKFYNALSK